MRNAENDSRLGVLVARAGTRRIDARIRRFLATLIAISLMIGLIPGIPLGAEVAYAGENVSLSVDREIHYSTARTNYMYTNGNIAYCAMPSKVAPPNGEYAISSINMATTNPNNSHRVIDIASTLWFGYGGPGFDATLWPNRWFDGNPVGDDEYLIMTHIVLSDFFNCDGGEALDNTTDEFKSWALSNVLAWNNGAYDPETPQARIAARAAEIPEEFAANCFQVNPGDNKQSIIGYVPGGWIDLKKASSNDDTTEGNECYSLEGAEYGIFRNYDCTVKAAEASMVTDSSGYAKSTYLLQDTYYVKELAAPKGYALDSNVYPICVQKGKTARVGEDLVYDTPLCSTAKILVAKLDSETGAAVAQGGASLADAQFTVRYYSGYYASESDALNSGCLKRTWVVRTDANGQALLDDSCLVSGDALYHSSDGRAAIPLGTLLIQETKAPEGYHLSDSSVHVRKITATGDTETSTAYNAPSISDQVIRGDVEFVKARESDQNRMGNIPFRIRNNATKESHIVVTDANGQASTSSQWNKHTANTNENDAAVSKEGTVDESKLIPTSGVWFGSSEPDDSKGALPYGTYTIEELRVSGNAGLALIKMPSLTIGPREGQVVNLGTFDDQTLTECAISTYAREYETGSKTANADIETRIVDRVQYSNLDVTEGKAYELHASLLDASTGEALCNDMGEPITGFARFVPNQQNGYAEVALSFDSRMHAGSDVVVYEELVKSDTGAIIAEHKDTEDYDQTIHITGQILNTHATDPYDGDKTISADPQAAITDTVNYRNLVSGKEYELVGTLWIKGSHPNEDGTDLAVYPLMDEDGHQFTATKTFVPDHPDGSVDVEFACDSSSLSDQELVVFEKLYREGQVIAEHEDASDSDQTVSVREPVISTVVADILDGNDTVSADAVSCVVDTVRYENVIPGKRYSLKGELMLKSNIINDDASVETVAESMLDSDGKAIVSQASFTPETSSGETQVQFDFDSRIRDGSNVVVYETLMRDDVVVAKDCDPNNENQSFSIHATSTSTYLEDARTASKQVTADSEAIIEDNVRYADAVIGDEYTVYGMLIDPDSGLPILQHSDQAADDPGHRAESLMRKLFTEACGSDNDDIPLIDMLDGQIEHPRKFDLEALRDILDEYPDISGRLVLASNEFIADESSGATMLEYELDARGLEGKRATSCIAIIKQSSQESVCSEVDLTSEDQTVTFVTGSIHTIATDATDGDHELMNSSEARICDEISYEGLTPGKEYKIEGVLFDKDTKEALLVDDKRIEASKYFVPAASSGSENVEFSLDASRISGKEVVVYEYLYREMEMDDGDSEKVLVAFHADLDSEDQTVRISGSDRALAGTGYDKTGDTTGPVIAIGAAALPIAIFAVIYGIRQMTARNRKAQAAVERALRGL